MAKEDEFSQFVRNMQDSTDYLGIAELKDQYCYVIYARNAYVGVWVKPKKAFLISRYKVGPHPYLFCEFHWDTMGPCGTAKPLELIEKFPFKIKEHYDNNEKEEILEYLDSLEENNPIIEGFNSLQQRRLSAINFGHRLAGNPRRT